MCETEQIAVVKIGKRNSHMFLPVVGEDMLIGMIEREAKRVEECEHDAVCIGFVGNPGDVAARAAFEDDIKRSGAFSGALIRMYLSYQESLHTLGKVASSAEDGLRMITLSKPPRLAHLFGHISSSHKVEGSTLASLGRPDCS